MAHTCVHVPQHLAIVVISTAKNHVYLRQTSAGLEDWILGLCWVSPPVSHCQWSDGGGTVTGPLVVRSPVEATWRNALSPRCSDSTCTCMYMYIHVPVHSSVYIHGYLYRHTHSHSTLIHPLCNRHVLSYSLTLDAHVQRGL